MSTTDFQKDKFLGKGTYGSVHRVVRITTGKVYALKEVDMRNKRQDEREEAVNEIRLLAMVKHPNIIRYRESFFENEHLYIVTDFADSGDASGLINKFKAQRAQIPEADIWGMFVQLCQGIKYLHSKHILHRDLKTSNVFLTGPPPHVVKIGDLGVAKLLKTAATQTQVGTPYYISPEIWKKLPYNEKSDIWSLGCVLYELCTYRHPFTATSPKELAQRILRGRFAPVTGYSKDMCTMVDCLLCVDTMRRPNINGVLAHPIMTSRFPELLNAVPVPVSPTISVTAAPVINTIKVPRNLTRLGCALPPAAYITPAAPGNALKRRSDPTAEIARKLDFEEPEQKHHVSAVSSAAIPPQSQPAPMVIAPSAAFPEPQHQQYRRDPVFAVPIAPVPRHHYAAPAVHHVVPLAALPPSAAAPIFAVPHAPVSRPSSRSPSSSAPNSGALGGAVKRPPPAYRRQENIRQIFGLPPQGAAALAKPIDLNIPPVHHVQQQNQPSVPHYAAPRQRQSLAANVVPVAVSKASLAAEAVRPSTRDAARHAALLRYQQQRHSQAFPVAPLRDISNAAPAQAVIKPLVRHSRPQSAIIQPSVVEAALVAQQRPASARSRPSLVGIGVRPSSAAAAAPRAASPPRAHVIPGVYMPDRFRARPSVVF